MRENSFKSSSLGFIERRILHWCGEAKAGDVAEKGSSPVLERARYI
jgi:hypothetical protein